MTNKVRFALVVVGYNRLDGMLRLIDSLKKACFDEQVDLIISIDNSGSNEVELAANSIKWPYGNKTIYTYEKRLGLRKHILHCGEFLNNYEAIAVFEDDIIVSPSFFLFMKQAYMRYHDDMNIAGVSLYCHEWNSNASLPFSPLKNQYDAYFIQLAQSWGQIWFKKQMFDFLAWYYNNSEPFDSVQALPSNINCWPDTSWLKYHIRYCVEKNKYFVYPYTSLTTCFVDVGEHSKKTTNLFQVMLLNGKKEKYDFPSLDEGIKYDAFFEPVLLDSKINGISFEDITMDLYGTKTFFNKRYILSSQFLNYKVIKRYGLVLRPHESNVLNDVKGAYFYLYDSEHVCKAPNNQCQKYDYYFKFDVGKIRTKDMLSEIKRRFVLKIKKR